MGENEENLELRNTDWLAEIERLATYISKHALTIGAVLTVFGTTYLIVIYGWLHVWDMLRSGAIGLSWTQGLERELINRQLRLLEYPLLGLSVASLIGGILLLVYKVRMRIHAK